MNYTKPEVSTLGDVTKVIEYVGTSKPLPATTDPVIMPKHQPAYDLDE